MQDTVTTLKGRIGSDPVMKHVKGDTCVTTFRMAITRWRFTSDTQPGSASYVEDGANWYTIETWDTLAQNVFRSCRKGDPVVVVARPVPNGWIDAAGQIRSAIVFRASAVGHDLARGCSRFTKNQAHGLAEPAAGSPGDPYSTRPEQAQEDADAEGGLAATPVRTGGKEAQADGFAEAGSTAGDGEAGVAEDVAASWPAAQDAGADGRGELAAGEAGEDGTETAVGPTEVGGAATAQQRPRACGPEEVSGCRTRFDYSSPAVPQAV